MTRNFKTPWIWLTLATEMNQGVVEGEGYPDKLWFNKIMAKIGKSS